MALHLTEHRAGFGFGRTPITTLADETGIALSVWRLRAGEAIRERSGAETAWMLMDGELELELDGRWVAASRRSLFDEAPTVLHAPAGLEVHLRARHDAELTVYATAGAQSFPPRLILPEQVRVEARGKGAVDEAALRYVRTVFDRQSGPAEAMLVLGEVVGLPGRWSSYPPHHHPQPELYHYRFQPAGGWGHAELGETVLKVRHGDTVKILDGVDHPQCAAPGYAMYYSWAIRHLADRPYTVPDFTAEHRWTMDQGAAGWRPQGAR